MYGFKNRDSVRGTCGLSDLGMNSGVNEIQRCTSDYFCRASMKFEASSKNYKIILNTFLKDLAK